MSFHGGLFGVMIAFAIFAVRRGRRIADVFDFAAPLPGIGICAVRIGNFINGELWGKPTDVPWGVRSSTAKCAARHAALRGVARRRAAVHHPVVVHVQAAAAHGARPGCSSCIYSLSRITVEFWRVPDHHLNYLLRYLLGHHGHRAEPAHAAHRPRARVHGLSPARALGQFRRGAAAGMKPEP